MLRRMADPEHRYRCCLCGWDGLQSEAAGYKQMTFTARFPICPGCGQWRTGVGVNRRSAMVGYAREKKR